MKPSAIVIGAGIVGLATARALATRGYKVTVIDRSSKAVGASIRNFGMVWPVGQPNGTLYNRALHSKAIWKEVCNEANIWYDEVGSLHLAYHDDESQVIQEVIDLNKNHRPLQWLTPEQTLYKSPAVNPKGLKGALFSADEVIIESRKAIEQIPAYFAQKYQMQFVWDTAISNIEGNTVYAGTQSWQADHIYVCTGADFETLYPEAFKQAPITKCKLQMLRLASQGEDNCIGPALCGGLSLIHYKGFEAAPSLAQLKKRYEAQYPKELQWGIHVMASQNGLGELTIGDSHEYGLTFDPFDKSFINNLIMDYLKTFANFKQWEVMQTWNGIYAKMTNGATEWVQEINEHTTIINALSGAGMTLSFGLADEIVAKQTAKTTASIY